MSKRLGIIQSRGLGDLIIALPIAKWYHNEGWEVYWPICEEFYPSMKDTAPWVKWIPIPTDPIGHFFYDIPMERLKNFKCDEIHCLYQALTGHPELSAEPYFQCTKFDQYKYIKMAVPFTEKWNLAPCLTRNPEREQALYDRVVQNDNYVVLHLRGSDKAVDIDRSIIPQGWQQIEITEQTDCIFDWLKVIEGAQSLIMIDSCYSNLVDQLGIGEDNYFIQRSHIGLTPVQNLPWTWL